MFKLDFTKVNKNQKDFFLLEAQCHEWVEYNRSLKAWVFKKEYLEEIREWIGVVNAPIEVIKISS